MAQLNIEVSRLATYIWDEDICLREKVIKLSASHSALAHQVTLHWMERACFNAHHLKVLGDIYLLPSFTGSVGFGIRVAEAPATTEAPKDPVLPPGAGTTPNREEDSEELEGEQAGEDEEVAVLGAVFDLLDISFDVQDSQE